MRARGVMYAPRSFSCSASAVRASTSAAATRQAVWHIEHDESDEHVASAHLGCCSGRKLALSQPPAMLWHNSCYILYLVHNWGSLCKDTRKGTNKLAVPSHCRAAPTCGKHFIQPRATKSNKGNACAALTVLCDVVCEVLGDGWPLAPGQADVCPQQPGGDGAVVRHLHMAHMGHMTHSTTCRHSW